MRILLVAVILFVVIHFIRIDLVEGTIPSAPLSLLSSEAKQQEECLDETIYIYVSSIEGDTIESLFSLYPDSEMSFMDRLTTFYNLNPHLKKQSIIGGEKIKLPLSGVDSNNCVE